MPIWLGGPEVSMMQKEVLRRLPCVKGVMKGEGEKTFKEICRIYRNEFEKEKMYVDIRIKMWIIPGRNRRVWITS